MATTPPRTTQQKVLAATLTFTAACCFFIAGDYGLEHWRGRQSATWPTVIGTVLERKTFKVDPTRSTHPPTYYLIKMRYEYEVDGQHYEADRYNAYTGRVDKQEADHALTAYRPNSPCTVSYNPADPAAAYIAPGQKPTAWIVESIMGGLGIVILLVAAAAWLRIIPI